MLTPEEIISATPDGPSAQSRLGRLALAHLTADTLMAANVFGEIFTDKRGQDVALYELVQALTSGMAAAWVATTDRDATIAFVREQIAALEQQGGVA
jgi:hypothetical protein